MINYYEDLGVPRDATPEAIKRAFRLAAQKYHPDRANGDEAWYKTVQAAYDVLGDPIKRAAYDRGESDFSSLEVRIEREATTNLIKLFASMVNNLDIYQIEAFNFKYEMLTAINQADKQNTQNVHEAKKALKKLRVVKRRLKGGHFMFVSHIDQQRLACINGMKQIKFIRKVSARSKELLADFEYDYFQEQFYQSSFAQSSAQWSNYE